MIHERQVDLEKSTNVRFPRLTRRAMQLAGAMAPDFTAKYFAKKFLTPWIAATPLREEAWVQGALPHTVRSGDYRLSVSSLGLGGPQVLLVHGWSGRGSQLGAFIEPLLDAGFEVNWFDLPAHGQSTGEQSGLVDAVEAVQAVTQWLGGAHTVIAHSMGAAATTLAAARGAEIGRMVYLCPPDDVGSFLAAVGRKIGLPEAVIDQARGHIERRFGVSFEDLIPTQVAAGLGQPMLAVHDRDDREVQLGEVEQLVAAWPKASFVVTEGLGHRRILRDPEVLGRVLDFVTRKGTARAA